MSNVTFKRSPNVNSIPIVDGQLIFDETNNKIYMDNGEQRLQYGGDVSLISSVDYATANNAFSALATTELFLNKNTVVDSKTDALAATEQGLPVGCLAFQSAIGQADYSSIDNTISACLLTINNKFTSQLKANNNDIYMDYHDGKYGVNTSSTRGADTFIPFKSTDEIIKALPKSLWCQAYHGGTSDSGYGSSTTGGIIVPFDGTLTCTVSFSGDGWGSFSATQNGESVISGMGSGTRTISFAEGDTFSFGANVSGLENWARGTITVNLTWVAN